MRIFGRGAGPLWRQKVTLTLASLAVFPALAACSSYSSAPNNGPTPSVVSESEHDGSDGAHPSVSLAALFHGSTNSSPQPTAIPHPPGSYTQTPEPGAVQGQYVAPPRQYSSAAALPPPQSYAAASAPPAEPNPTKGVYPSVSLSDLFKGSTTTPSGQQGVPHPPSSYTPGAAGSSAPESASLSPYPEQSLADVFRAGNGQ